MHRAGYLAMGMSIDASILQDKAWSGQPAGVHVSPHNPLTGTYRTADRRLLTFVMLQPGRYWADVCKHIGRDDLATIMYTSGTTGPPKGVVQTHGNHMATLASAARMSGIQDGDTHLLFLPLAIPIVVGGVGASVAGGAGRYLAFLALYDGLFAILCWASFEYVVTE